MSNFNNELKEYQNIPRTLIFDSEISDRARFVFCFMAAKPDDWDFYMSPMAKEIGYSVDTLRKYINELVERGWLVKGEQSRLDGNIFGAVEYTLKAQLPTRKNSDTEKFRHGKNNAQHNIDYNIKDTNNIKEKKEDTKVSKKNAKVNWRGDFEVYKSECEKSKEELIADKEFEEEVKKLYPNIDYYRSVVKSVIFWESDRGWETKKKSKSTNINMTATIKRNFDKNIVYQNRQNEPIQNERLLRIEKIDDEGTLRDGTIFKGGYRYYFSNKDKRTYSIPVDAEERPDERWEYDSKNGWYLPEEEQGIDDMLW